jgi:putative holliday junction resolvase
MIYLCFDYGLARIGVARSYGTLAEPLQIVANDEQMWDNIANLVKEHQPDRVVVGVSEGQMEQESRKFGQAIEKQFQLPVEFFDETLSSQEVEGKLKEAKAKLKARQQPQDHLVAAHILQQFLDTRV